MSIFDRDVVDFVLPHPYFYSLILFNIRSCLKKRILAQILGGNEFQPAGILKYVEDLKQGANTEVVSKDLFEMGSKNEFM